MPVVDLLRSLNPSRVLGPIRSSATAVTRNVSARYSSPVILYHSTFQSVPEHMRIGVHNVDPDEMIKQIDWLARSHRFLAIDEWFAEGKPAGTAVVTFDDGYNSVCELALPRLIERGIPATVFLNGASFHGEVFWRDKVLFLINSGGVNEFLNSTPALEAGLNTIEEARFYKATKMPALNSHVVNQALDRFLDDSGLSSAVPRETAQTKQDLVDDPLVTYGNHSYRHYLPSSLTPDQQRHEIFANETALDDLGVNRSKVFSIPFGDNVHVNETTEALVSEAGFVGVLFSSNAVNFSAGPKWAGLPTGQRYMAAAKLPDFRFHHARLSFLRPDAKVRALARGGRDRVKTLIP